MRGLGLGPLALSGAIHVGAALLLLPGSLPPEQTRGLLVVGVALVAESGLGGGGIRVAADTPPTAPERVAAEPPVDVAQPPPDAAHPVPPDTQLAEAPPAAEAPSAVPPLPEATRADVLEIAPAPEPAEIATGVAPAGRAAEAPKSVPPKSVPPKPAARPTRAEVRPPPPREVVHREPRREAPAGADAPHAPAEGLPSANVAVAAAPVPARTGAGVQHIEAGAPAPVGSGGDATDYMLRLRAWLERHKDYPRRARLRHQEGTAMLRFVVDGRGRVLSHRIDRTSGHDLLDEAVEEMIARAQPLPAPPPDMGRDRLEIVVPVQFVLR